MLFQVLRKGREKKLGRPLTEDELHELELYASRSSTAGVHVAKHQGVSERARAAVAALPKSLPSVMLGAGRLPLAPTRDLSRSKQDARTRRRAGRAIQDVGVLLRMAARDGRRGPQLPVYARRTSALYIQQDDVEDLIPDGWGASFPTEAGALGRAMGLPPLAIPLLCLLEWTSSFRPAIAKDKNGCGAGFQVSLDWLARKMGCSRVWVQGLLNRMDPCAPWRRECLETKRENRRRIRAGRKPLGTPERPTGTTYIHRFRRLKRYEDTCPEAAKRRIWIDTQGRPHVYVDVRGVVYLTEAGRKVLGRPRARLDAAHYIDREGRRVRWILAARLRRGHHMLGSHIVEVLENRREILAAPGVPENLSPNHSPQETSPPS